MRLTSEVTQIQVACLTVTRSARERRLAPLDGAAKPLCPENKALREQNSPAALGGNL